MSQSPPAASRIDERALQSIAAITERTRLQILFLLGEQGRMCVGDLAGHFRISRPAVSHHLKILKDNGLVLAEKAGQETFYSVNTGHLAAMLRRLADALEECCPEQEGRQGG